MFGNATISLFVAITIFMIVMVVGRDQLARRGISKPVAQGVAALAATVVAAGFLLATG